MKYTGTYILCIAATAIIMFFAMRNCEGDHLYHNEGNSITVDTVYRIDTLVSERISYIPKYSVIRDTINIINRIIDTVEVVERFFEKRVYQDTLQDSLFKVVVIDTIFKNEIVSRSWKGQILSKTQTITKIVHPNPTYISAGAVLTIGQTPGISAMLYFTKNKHTAGVGYDVLNKGLTVSYNYKFKEYHGKKNRY
ncbi:MAG: hypothetical protein WC389_16035 [Lutibacter sp.]|jgi:hypothetical protein